MNDLLDEAAGSAGKPYGMTADQVVAYIAIGDRRHGDARPGECGAVDPRNESQWCREPAGHASFHSPVASPPALCGVLLPPYDPYTYCHRPARHDWSQTCTETPEESP